MSKPSLINENINRIYTFWLNSAGWNILKIKCPCCQFWFRHTVQKVDLRPCCLKEFALSHMRVKLLDFPISFSPSLEEKQTAEMFTRPESDRVVYWKRHYHGLETSAFVFFCGACDNYEPNRYVIWSALECQSTLDFFSSEPSCHF